MNTCNYQNSYIILRKSSNNYLKIIMMRQNYRFFDFFIGCDKMILKSKGMVA